ncbi:unnamed protein product, partial [Iphiclides podalirius]
MTYVVTKSLELDYVRNYLFHGHRFTCSAAAIFLRDSGGAGAGGGAAGLRTGPWRAGGCLGQLPGEAGGGRELRFHWDPHYPPPAPERDGGAGRRCATQGKFPASSLRGLYKFYGRVVPRGGGELSLPRTSPAPAPHEPSTSYRLT